MFILAALIAGAAHAGTASNPAFLGIARQDAPVGCAINAVIPGSAAEEAGLRPFDLIVAIDGVRTTRQRSTAPCDVLVNQLVSHPPGDTVQLDILRGTSRLTVQVTLSTRAEVLHRRFVGRPLPPVEVSDVDDAAHTYDLGMLRGRTTVIGWFSLQSCSGCASVFERVADGLAHRMHGTSPRILAVTAMGLTGDPKLFRKAFTTEVPLALASDETFADFSIAETDRIHFMVIDCRGVVRFVAPVAPGSDDREAAIDEVLAAAEQADNDRGARR